MLSALVNRLARLASPATAHQRAIRLSDQGKLPEAFSLLALAARAGIADAEYRVARCYLEGLGVPPSQVEGTRWLQRAANHGVVEAQALLGAIFATGLVSVDVDRPEGTASADRLFASDVSGEPDLSSALKWARRAAEAGSAKGQAVLALLWQIYSRRFALQIHFRQCGHRCGGGRAMSSRIA
jgi:TPR repeat protein